MRKEYFIGGASLLVSLWRIWYLFDFWVVAGGWLNTSLICFGIWIVPFLIVMIGGWRNGQLPVPRLSWSLWAFALTTAGAIGSFKTAVHIGLLLAMGAWMPVGWGTLLWVVGGICWTPAMGWLVLRTIGPLYIVFSKYALAIISVFPFFYSRLSKQRVRS